MRNFHSFLPSEWWPSWNIVPLESGSDQAPTITGIKFMTMDGKVINQNANWFPLDKQVKIGVTLDGNCQHMPERNVLMKRLLIITFILLSLFIPSYAVAASQEQKPTPVEINVLLNNRPISLPEKPVITDQTLFLPLREIAESLGIKTVWDSSSPNQVKLTKDNKELVIIKDSKKVLYGRKLFFMDKAPVVINGHTLVPFRFITDVLGIDYSWNEKHNTLSIADNGNFLELPAANAGQESDTDNYYKWFNVLIGPVSGPNAGEAEEYVIKNGILNEVKDIQSVYVRFTELSDSVTMVSGVDKDNHERIVWLSKDNYIGDISVVGTVLINSGISKEKVLSILKENGIDENSIKQLYIGPYENGQIIWFVITQQGDKESYYRVDFLTGTFSKEI